MTLPTKPDETPQDGWTLRGVIRNTLIAFALFVFVPLIIGVIASVNDTANAAQRVEYLRDLLWVIILLLTVPLLLGMGLFLIQLAVLFGMIRLDVSEVLGEAKGAFGAIAGTARFIGETVARPIIRVWTFFSGGWTFTRELLRLFAAIRRRPNPEPSPESNETTPQE